MTNNPTHDYKGALEECDAAWLDFDNGVREVSDICRVRHAAIRHALLLADKVTGEPSVDACLAGNNMYRDAFGTPLTRQAHSFKAMIQQAEREIG